MRSETKIRELEEMINKLNHKLELVISELSRVANINLYLIDEEGKDENNLLAS